MSGSYLTAPQALLLLATSGSFLLAFAYSIRGMRPVPVAAQSTDGAGIRPAADHQRSTAALVAGIALAVGLLGWRAAVVGQSTLPLSDFVDAFLLLGLMLAVMCLAFRTREHLRGVAVFLLPMIAVLVVLGAVLSWAGERRFEANTPTVIHIISVLVGFGCFATGCVGAVVYLVADRQLRRKSGRGGVGGGGVVDPAHRLRGLGPLASVERFIQRVTILGFPFLTLAVITGFFLLRQPGSLGAPWFLSPKVILTLAAWLIYAFLLQVRLTPSFRGPRAAWLSILGFLLLILVFVAVNWMPDTTHAAAGGVGGAVWSR